MNVTGVVGAVPIPGSDCPARILILWADDASPNLGVRALGRGTEALLRRVWPEAVVTFVNYGHGSPHLPMGRLRSLVREQVTGRAGMQRWLAGFDLVIDTRSGDSFADIYGLERHTMMSAVAACVARSGVPMVLSPQTIGPFGSRRGRLLARHTLSRTKLVMVRDSESAAAAARLGRDADVLATDVVFAIDIPTLEKSRDVALNISGLLWHPNPHLDHRVYRETVRRLHDRLLAKNRNLTLLAHVLDSGNAANTDNDESALLEFMQWTGSTAEVLVPQGLDEVRAAVASANVVLGSRMHACLNALSVGTPAIPLAYSRKFEPLLRGLGWNHTVDLRDTAIDPVAAALEHLADTALLQDVAGTVARAQQSLLVAEQSLRALA